MTAMFEQLQKFPRLLLEQELQPIQGSRFQPTGFPDLGAADFRRADEKKTRMLLVESAQSMANRLEKTCLKGDGPHIDPALEGLPYVVAKLSGAVDTETSSLIEAHRINSPWIISNKAFQGEFLKKSGCEKGMPLDWSKIAETLFYFDPNSLIHGLFLVSLDSRIRLPRALSGFIEASDVVEVVSGGVKNDALDPTGKLIRAEESIEKAVYGNIPYPRVEYTAGRIVAYFNLDLALIRGYGLPPDAEDLLIALAMLKVRRLLSSGLRLRTACDLTTSGEVLIAAPGYKLPPQDSLLATVQSGIKVCAAAKLFANPSITTIKTPAVKPKPEKETAAVPAPSE
jgi:CRISPR-associated protein Csb1